MMDYLREDISRHVWETKYRYNTGSAVHDQTVEDTWRRVAVAAAAAEKNNQGRWENTFYEAMTDFAFLPGGRILAGAGTAHRVTLFSCFVMGLIDDSLDGIFSSLKEASLTMQQGGGVGYDFSTLRPAGTRNRTTGTIASGPVSFMRIWDTMCATVLSTGARRGAMMATLRCDHPDIETFIDVKRDRGELRNFNLSVQITDAFMAAVREDKSWPLVFPDDRLSSASETEDDIHYRRWTGSASPMPCRVIKEISARGLWERIMRATYDCAEPGVLFVDSINRLNNLHYREQITATNPCGEIPLPPYGACNLGSINLTRFVADPFTENARLDFDGITRVAAAATRFLDNVIDISHYPVEEQASQARGTRRVGLGITGLADALIMLGLRYDSSEGRAVAASVMREICYAAYRTSIALAREKEPFPYFERQSYLDSAFVRSLPEPIQEGIREHGIRNSHLTAIAPTGTISLLANNVSSGIEPVFAFTFERRVLRADGAPAHFSVSDYAYRLWHTLNGSDAPLPAAFVDAHSLSPAAHLAMQETLQQYVDSAISKTINIPGDYPFEAFADLYESAFKKGLKGCTTFRPNPVTGSVLEVRAPAEGQEAPHCCHPARETD